MKERITLITGLTAVGKSTEAVHRVKRILSEGENLVYLYGTHMDKMWDDIVGKEGVTEVLDDSRYISLRDGLYELLEEHHKRKFYRLANPEEKVSQPKITVVLEDEGRVLSWLSSPDNKESGLYENIIYLLEEIFLGDVDTNINLIMIAQTSIEDKQSYKEILDKANVRIHLQK